METEADFAAVLGEFHFSGPWMVNLVEVAGGAEEFNFLFFFPSAQDLSEKSSNLNSAVFSEFHPFSIIHYRVAFFLF